MRLAYGLAVGEASILRKTFGEHDACLRRLKDSPLGVSLVGVALTEEASLTVENAPLLLLRISQCALPAFPSPLGLANGGNPVVGLPRPSPSYFASLRTVGLSPSSRSTSVSLSLAAAPGGTCRSFFVVLFPFDFLIPGKAAGRLFLGLLLPFPTP